MFEIMQRKPEYIEIAISLFEKIEDNMIIQKKRKKIFNGYGVSRNKL